jgi:hypothetical protein
MKIEDWLKKIGCEAYVSVFKENGISIKDLNSLTSEDLKTELGINKLIDRKIILEEISKLKIEESFQKQKLSEFIKVENIPYFLYEPFHEFKNESHPRVKLFWLIDTAEIAVKFTVSILFADLLRSNNGQLIDALKFKLIDHIERPTLGKWLGILNQLTLNSKKDEFLVPNIIDINSNVISKYFLTESQGGNIDNSLLILRNQLAHGGGMSIDKSNALVVVYEKIVSDILNNISNALYDCRIIAKNHSEGFNVFSNEILNCVIPKELLDKNDGVWLIRNNESMNLAPISVFESIQQISTNGELTIKDKPSLQIYARSSKDKLIYSPIGSNEAISESNQIEEFRLIFGLDSNRAKLKTENKSNEILWDDFIREARIISEDLVGRQDELKIIKNWLKTRESFDLFSIKTGWVSGGPGIGKSLLISKIVADYSNASSKNKGIFYFRFRGGDSRNNRITFLNNFRSSILAWEAIKPLLSGLVIEETQNASELITSLKQILPLIENIPKFNDKAPKSEFWIFADGIDEIIASDRSIVAMFYELVMPGTVWLFSGRPENELDEIFRNNKAEFLFENGLPQLGANDIRSMFLEGLGKIKYELFKLDEDKSEGIENIFINNVVKKADGLPIYINLLLNDISSGLFKISANNNLPNGLSEYYDVLLDRIGLSSVKRDLPIIISLLAIAEEPLDTDALTILLSNNISEDYEFYNKRVKAAINAGLSLLRHSPTSYNTDGWILYHQSFRDHVTGASNPKIKNALYDVVIESQNLLCRTAGNWSLLNSSTLKNHLFQYGNKYTMRWTEKGKFYVLGRLTDLNYILSRLTELGSSDIFSLVDDYEVTLDELTTEALDGVMGFGIPQWEQFNVWVCFFRENARIIFQGNQEWSADKITFQLALEYAKESPITLAANKIIKINRPKLLVSKSNIPIGIPITTFYRTIKIHESKITGLTALDNKNIISWDLEGYISIWNLFDGKIMQYFKLTIYNQIEKIIALPNGGFLLHADGILSQWNIKDKEPFIVFNINNISDLMLIEQHGDPIIKYKDKHGGIYDSMPSVLPNFKSEDYSQIETQNCIYSLIAINKCGAIYLFNLNNADKLAEIKLESEILNYIFSENQLIALSSSGLLYNIKISKNSLELINSIKYEKAKGLIKYNKTSFIVWTENEFHIISFSSLDSVGKSIINGDVLFTLEEGFLIAKNYKYFPSKDYFDIEVFNIKNRANITKQEYLEPYGLHWGMAANHCNVYLHGTKLIRTFFYGLHVNIYDIINASNKHFEFSREVSHGLSLNKKLFGIPMNDKIAIINTDENILSTEQSRENAEWNTRKLFYLNENYFCDTLKNGDIQIYDSKKIESLKFENYFHLYNTCVFKIIDEYSFYSLSFEATYEWGGRYILSYYSIDSDLNIVLKATNNKISNLNESLPEDVTFINNNDYLALKNLFEKEKIKLDMGIDYCHNSLQIDKSDNFERIDFRENKVMLKNKKGLIIYVWFSEFEVNNIQLLTNDRLIVQYGIKYLEILEINNTQHPTAP